MTHPRTSRVHALAFNALTKALSEADVFVRLSDRETITAAVVAAAGNEIGTEIDREAFRVYAAADDRVHELARANGLAKAASIARGEA